MDKPAKPKRIPPPSDGGKGKERIPAAVAQAVKIIATTGVNQAQAAKLAGISEAAFSRALQRAIVRNLRSKLESAFIARTDANLVRYRARAYDVAADIMEHGDTAASRMRAVEFLAGGKGAAPAQTTVNVAIGGYAYVRPGEQVVEIGSGTRPDGGATDGHAAALPAPAPYDAGHPAGGLHDRPMQTLAAPPKPAGSGE